MDNPRERISSEREVQVDGGRLGGVWDHGRPAALCTPTSLFSLQLSTTSTTDNDTHAPIGRTYATAEGTMATEK